jgi:F-type H+-transporting ATPase subunit gamma
MSTLKALSMRIRAVTNIQKITKSMKMVSAAKYAKAERELKPARVYGQGSQAFYEKAELVQEEKKPNHLIIAMTSDRGLCGAVHTNIARAIKAIMPELDKEGANVKMICIGDKSKAILQRLYRKNIIMNFTDIGKKPTSFGDAAVVANMVLEYGEEFDVGHMYYNVFKTVVSYKTTQMPIFRQEHLENAKKISMYDSLDEEVLRSYHEFSFCSQIFFAMKENACSEQSARMTAMDAASKNAGEMIGKLTLTYNRTRQAVITKELIEIISGAAALK